MSAVQRNAWFNLVVVLVAVALVVGLRVLMGWPRAIAGFGTLGLLGFGPLFYRRRGAEVVADERDASIQAPIARPRLHPVLAGVRGRLRLAADGLRREGVRAGLAGNVVGVVGARDRLRRRRGGHSGPVRTGGRRCLLRRPIGSRIRSAGSGSSTAR